MLPVWFLLSLLNSWFAVTRMDSPLREETRTFAMIFIVPALAALFVWWKYSG